MQALVFATGRASRVRQVMDDDPRQKGIPGPQGWGLGVRLTTPPRKNYYYETYKQYRGGQVPLRANDYYYYYLRLPSNNARGCTTEEK